MSDFRIIDGDASVEWSPAAVAAELGKSIRDGNAKALIVVVKNGDGSYRFIWSSMPSETLLAMATLLTAKVAKDRFP